MANPCFLSIVGEQQGEITGGSDILDREGTIIVHAVDHTVEIPTDSRGVSTGRRVHRPLIVTKEIDESSPMLYQALCTGERLSEVELNWYRVEEAGGQELYFTTYLENALINRIHPWMPNTMDATKTGFRHMEDVSFIYERIRWTWVPDGIEYEDRWGELLD